LPTSEKTARGTGLGKTAGKEDPVELDCSLKLFLEAKGAVISGSIYINEIPLPLNS